MTLSVQVTFHGVPHSDPIDQYVRNRADKLEMLAARITGCHVTLEMPHRHARHGEHFRVRVNVILPGGQVVVARSPDEARTYEDLYAAIDSAFDDLGRSVQGFVRRQRGDVKPHERSRHAKITKLFGYEGYGFLTTAEGDELYFHRNSVLDAAFDRLKIGDRVRFVEDEGGPSPHASTVALPGNGGKSPP
jgi:ribosome-associated translation inhibitor RaiA/cold shock CspA family protein